MAIHGPGPSRAVYVCDLAPIGGAAHALLLIYSLPQFEVSGARRGHIVSPLSKLIHDKVSNFVCLSFGSISMGNSTTLRSVWKSLVASCCACVCVCVWLKFERAFSTCSSPARNGFVSSSITRSSSN